MKQLLLVIAILITFFGHAQHVDCDKYDAAKGDKATVKTLDLSGCNLVEIPSGIRDFESLEYLILDENSVRYLVFDSLPDLVSLSVVATVLFVFIRTLLAPHLSDA